VSGYGLSKHSTRLSVERLKYLEIIVSQSVRHKIDLVSQVDYGRTGWHKVQ